jgi:hypothetical protein
LQLTQLVQTLQQPFPWCITVSCVQHTSSNTHDTKGIRTRNDCKLDIFSPHYPAKIDSNTHSSLNYKQKSTFQIHLITDVSGLYIDRIRQLFNESNSNFIIQINPIIAMSSFF